MPCVKQVANKVIELVMMQSGCDVCCTSEADRERMERVALKIDAEVLSETEGTQQLSKAQR
jgi:hypothetical protein